MKIGNNIGLVLSKRVNNGIYLDKSLRLEIETGICLEMYHVICTKVSDSIENIWRLNIKL